MKNEHLPPIEIGKVIDLDPFAIEISGQSYNSKDFTIYVPAVDRIIQHNMINIANQTNAIVELGDLEIEPGDYARLFRLGDIVSVSDRGDTFVIHNRLVKL